MSGHGHVTPNENGTVARCGGPGLCSECSQELSVSIKSKNDSQKQYEFEMGTPPTIKQGSFVNLASQVAIPSRALNELILAAQEMVEAYEPAYDNKWQYEDSWGKDYRRSYTEDTRVLKRLKDAILELRSPSATNGR